MWRNVFGRGGHLTSYLYSFCCNWLGSQERASLPSLSALAVIVLLRQCKLLAFSSLVG